MFKQILLRFPVLGKLAHSFYSKYVLHRKFTTSAQYWEERYKRGGDSGVGSYHQAAEYKAAMLNRFVKEHTIRTVIEFGCGDGNQLQYLHFPAYLGFDVSETAVSRCRRLYAGDSSKRFELLVSYAFEKADLVISLDVIYHLVEDPVFHTHMRMLFTASTRYVIIYANDTADNSYHLKAAHVKNRRFTDWIFLHAKDFQLIQHIPPPLLLNIDGQNAILADFYVYKKTVVKCFNDLKDL